MKLVDNFSEHPQRGLAALAVVLTLVGSALAPLTAAAQCGHHVAQQSRSGGHDHGSAAPAVPGASPQVVPATAEEPCCTENATAQSAWGGGSAVHSSSPYAGLESRPVKALSAERRQGLLAGAGLGYAMAAELNGHAGPKHVLDLGQELALTSEQRADVQASFDRMHAESVRLGTALVAAEEQLDRRFAHRHLDAELLARLTAEISRLEGELRYTHLVAHLETDALLTAEQRARYVELRGYARSATASGASGGEHVH